MSIPELRASTDPSLICWLKTFHGLEVVVENRSRFVSDSYAAVPAWQVTGVLIDSMSDGLLEERVRNSQQTYDLIARVLRNLAWKGARGNMEIDRHYIEYTFADRFNSQKRGVPDPYLVMLHTRTTLNKFRVFLQIFGPIEACVKNCLDVANEGVLNMTTPEDDVDKCLLHSHVGAYTVVIADEQRPWDETDYCNGTFALHFLRLDEEGRRIVQREYCYRIPGGALSDGRREYPNLCEWVAGFGDQCAHRVTAE